MDLGMNKKGLNLLLFTSTPAGVFLVSLKIWQGSDSSFQGFPRLANICATAWSEGI